MTKPMRLLLMIDYHKLLLPEDTDATAILRAFAGTVVVSEAGSYDDRKYIPKNDITLELKLVSPDAIITQEEYDKSQAKKK